MKYQVMPDLTTIEYESLKADIAEHGVLVPVEVDENGELLDGHHRVKAWHELKADGAELADYARIIRVGWSEEQKRNHARRLNVLRRHLSEDQRDDVIRAMRKDGMKQEQIAEATGVDQATVSRVLSNPEYASAYSEITNTRGQKRPAKYKSRKRSGGLYAPDAKTQDGTLGILSNLKERAPDLFDEVASGEMKPAAAQREANHRDKRNAPPLDGKYRVIYADPPWPYDNSGFDQSAEEHYPTMSIEDLCDLPVGEIADEPCALYMWATVPLMPDAFQVMAAWGFEYKTHRIWVKNKAPGAGWWLRTNHEVLLIGTKNGNAHPSERVESVVQHPVGRHSEKPAVFRQDIERCHDGPRIELFARTRVDGWHCWGNEV